MHHPVSIAIYSGGDAVNPYHWAIFVDNPQAPRVYEITGTQHHYEFRVFAAIPARSQRHVTNIRVGCVEPEDFHKVGPLLSATPIDNVSTNWTGHDWVMEALQDLCEAYVMDDLDEDYHPGVNYAVEFYLEPLGEGGRPGADADTDDDRDDDGDHGADDDEIENDYGRPVLQNGCHH